MSIKVYGDYDDVCPLQATSCLRGRFAGETKNGEPFDQDICRRRTRYGERVMEALKTVDRETNGQFGLRKLAVEKFTFKLPQAQLDVGTVSATIDDEACNFMILSHACHFLFRESTRPPRTPVASRRRHPLTPAMWNAFLKPRLSPTEPYRIDSLCITQPLGHEGGFATGAVDYVYRAGRKVIVVWEDTGNFVESSVSGVPESAEESPPMEPYALRAKTRLGGITPGPRGTMTRASRAK